MARGVKWSTSRWQTGVMNLKDPNERGHDAIRRAFLLKLIEVFRR